MDGKTDRWTEGRGREGTVLGEKDSAGRVERRGVQVTPLGWAVGATVPYPESIHTLGHLLDHQGRRVSVHYSSPCMATLHHPLQAPASPWLF
jgi:hypothetical protein